MLLTGAWCRRAATIVFKQCVRVSGSSQKLIPTFFNTRLNFKLLNLSIIHFLKCQLVQNVTAIRNATVSDAKEQ